MSHYLLQPVAALDDFPKGFLGTGLSAREGEKGYTILRNTQGQWLDEFPLVRNQKPFLSLDLALEDAAQVPGTDQKAGKSSSRAVQDRGAPQ